MFKKYIIFHMPHIIAAALFLVCVKHTDFWKAQSAVMGQLTQCIAISQTPQAWQKFNATYHNHKLPTLLKQL